MTTRAVLGNSNQLIPTQETAVHDLYDQQSAMQDFFVLSVRSRVSSLCFLTLFRLGEKNRAGSR
jgi:hypothetical protein